VTCSPLIVRATDHKTLGRDSERPQVLLSGALHGDERLGPAVVTETIRLLVHAALCDAPGAELQADVLGTGLDDVCNSTDARTRDWLWYLLTARDIFALPAANCAGYALRERSEKHVDPNRDFPFEQSPNKCMKTTTGNA
jgi:predicted deacylase